VFGTHRWTVKREQAPALKNTINDRMSEVLIVEDTVPGSDRLVRGEDHRALLPMASVDDVKSTLAASVLYVR
jgi:hypothetical protein